MDNLLRDQQEMKLASFTVETLVPFYFVDASAGDITITLLPPSQMVTSGGKQARVQFKRIDGSGNSVNVVSPSGVIEGLAVYPLAIHQSLTLFSDRTDYYVTRGAPAAAVTWDSVQGKPILFSGAYDDLSGKPTLFSGSYSDLTGKPSLFSGAYADLTGKPTIPTVPTVLSAFTNDSGFITSSALSGYATTASLSAYATTASLSSYATTASLSAYATTSALTSGLAGKEQTIAAGTTAQYWRGDKTWQTLPSVAARVFAYPARTIVTTTASTGFQIDATRETQVSYAIDTSTTATISASASVFVYLETAATNSTTPGDWTIIDKIGNGQVVALAVAFSCVQSLVGKLSAIIPAGKYVRIRSVIVGTASASVAYSQETKL